MCTLNNLPQLTAVQQIRVCRKDVQCGALYASLRTFVPCVFIREDSEREEATVTLSRVFMYRSHLSVCVVITVKRCLTYCMAPVALTVGRLHGRLIWNVVKKSHWLHVYNLWPQINLLFTLAWGMSNWFYFWNYSMYKFWSTFTTISLF